MGITSMQVCMDSSDWLQGTISEEGTELMDSSPITTPSGEDNNILTCSRPLIDQRRLRPQHEQSLKCPRCESTHTKFCYYNNYSLSQPRYFCKTCRRYWTKGGTLRNIPVGGGCRKNKKISSNSKKPSSSTTDHHNNNHSSSSSLSSASLILNQQNNTYSHNNPTELQLAFPDQLHFSSLHAAAGGWLNTTANSTGFLLENPNTPIDFMENKYEALVGSSHDNFMGNGGENFGGLMAAPNMNTNFHGINCSPFGMSDSLDHHGMNSGTGTTTILESCQRLMLPYDEHHHHHHHHLDQNHEVDVKPNSKILSLEWHDQHQQAACNSDAGKDSFGYNFGGLGSWTGLMNGYGSSATNPLV